MKLNKIIHGDCLEVMKTFEDNSIDICLTSPPYNLGKDTISGGFKRKQYNSHNDNMDSVEYCNWILTVISEMLRVTKYHIFFNIQEKQNTKGIYASIENYFAENLKEVFIWGKFNPPSHIVDTQCSNGYEKIYCISKDVPQIKKFTYCNFSNLNGDYLKNIILTNVNSESSFHKFSMPLHIPKYFINYFSKECDIVLDPFSGSATTAIACLDLNRQYLCIEKDIDYYNKSVERVAKELQKIKIPFHAVRSAE